MVVVAAGNNGRYQATNGYGTVTSPGNDPYVLTVGAMKPMGTPSAPMTSSPATAPKVRRLLMQS